MKTQVMDPFHGGHVDLSQQVALSVLVLILCLTHCRHRRPARHSVLFRSLFAVVVLLV